MSERKGHIGSSFEDYLEAEDTLEETNEIAKRRIGLLSKSRDDGNSGNCS